MSRPRTPPAKRLWSRVDMNMNGDHCWEWPGVRDSHGYGTLGVGRRKHVKAHRVAWESAVGPIPDGMHVLHHCDNPPCVRPSHLFLGTHDDNMADMARKGRGTPRSKLTFVQVLHARELLAQGARQSDIAGHFGVDPSTISLIATGKTWKRVA